MQKVLARQTWQIKDLAGPTKYPASTVLPSPACSQLIQFKDDGSGYSAVYPYSCSSRQLKVKQTK